MGNATREEMHASLLVVRQKWLSLDTRLYLMDQNENLEEQGPENWLVNAQSRNF